MEYSITADIEAVEPLHGTEPRKPSRVEDDAADAIVRESVGGRVDPHRQLLRVDSRGCRQHQRTEQRMPDERRLGA